VYRLITFRDLEPAWDARRRSPILRLLSGTRITSYEPRCDLFKEGWTCFPPPPVRDISVFILLFFYLSDPKRGGTALSPTGTVEASAFLILGPRIGPRRLTATASMQVISDLGEFFLLPCFVRHSLSVSLGTRFKSNSLRSRFPLRFRRPAPFSSAVVSVLDPGPIGVFSFFASNGSS